MATGKDIELRHYPKLPTDAVVFSAIWQLVDPTTKAPITTNPTQARFDVNQGEKVRCSLALASGLIWNAVAKQISILIRNSDLAFIKADAQYEYALYVVWDDGRAETIREGTVNAVRVA